MTRQGCQHDRVPVVARWAMARHATPCRPRRQWARARVSIHDRTRSSRTHAASDSPCSSRRLSLGAPLLRRARPTAPAGAAIKNTLTIDAKDYAFTLDGHLRPGQAQITVKNTGKEPHIIDLVKLKAGMTLKDVKKALNSHRTRTRSAKITNDPDERVRASRSSSLRGARRRRTTQLVKAGNYVTHLLPLRPPTARRTSPRA